MLSPPKAYLLQMEVFGVFVQDGAVHCLNPVSSGDMSAVWDTVLDNSAAGIGVVMRRDVLFRQWETGKALVSDFALDVEFLE